MKFTVITILCVLAIVGVALRWYQMKDSLSNYLRSKPRTGAERSQGTTQPDSE
jgi:hypothetical protein